jgi:glycosyltransferase involved in cell wall biosynthesis
VSVVIAVRNGERFLAQALDSVMAQNLPAHEIILVDGESTDSTVPIACRYEKVRVITQPGKGIANAYNSGISAATGDMVAFLSHDDLWTPDKLSLQTRALLDAPELGYVTALAKFFIEEGSEVPYGFRRELLQGSHVAHIMETLMARRETFSTVGPFDESLSTAEDVDWFSRAKDKAVPSAVVPHALLKKRIHGNNISLNVDANNRNLMQAIRQSVLRKRQEAKRSARK